MVCTTKLVVCLTSQNATCKLTGDIHDLNIKVNSSEEVSSGGGNSPYHRLKGIKKQGERLIQYPAQDDHEPKYHQGNYKQPLHNQTR